MKKILLNEKVKDLIFISILILFFFVVSLITTDNGKYILGSTTDFGVQHYPIPEYFRTLFYKDFNLLPDFAFNIGGGQNIYYLSYYGLLSPIVLFSYLFPMIRMVDYMIMITFILIVISCVMLYYYLKKNKYSSLISFLGTFIFLTASPIIFHSHRHIMFINYFPFLIMGFYGIDKYLKENKSLLIIASITLMIFTSFYYSIPGIMVIYILGLYKNIKENHNTKELINYTLKITIRIIISILISAILLLPTLYTLLNGRVDEVKSLNILELFIPHLYMLYDSYSIGLTLISVAALIYMFITKKKENIFLGIILLLISVFPIFNYILNGFLYINAKVLIPFILLYIIVICELLNDKFNNKKIKYSLITYILISSTIVCMINIKDDKLIEREEINSNFNKNYSTYVDNIIKNENNLYRINSEQLSKGYINIVGNSNDYKTSMYSSAFNNDYREFYVKTFNNPLSRRNKFMMTSSNSLLYQIFSGEKYLFSKGEYNSIYKKINIYDDINLYENDYVLPIIYATSKNININDFNNLSYPDNIINILGSTVTEDKTNFELIKSEKIDLDYTVLKTKNLKYEKVNNDYIINSKNDGKIVLELNNDLTNKLLFISFDNLENVACQDDKVEDLSIKINGFRNKLTCKDWKYNNENINFSYTLFDIKDNKLTIKFDKGKYKLGNIKISALDFNKIKNINKEVDEFIFNKDETKGNKIVGTINVKNDSNIMMTIPYDDGFNILVDGKNVEYYKTNDTFIYFNINKGNHDIEITYNAPLKKEGLVISCIGILSTIGLCIIERKKTSI